MTDEVGGLKVTFDLSSAILRLQAHNRRRYTYREIGKATGIHENTVQRLATAPMRRLDMDTVEAFIKYFRSEGLTDFTMDDLFVIQAA